MAAKYKLLVLLCSSFLLSVRGQCPGTSFYLARDGELIFKQDDQVTLSYGQGLHTWTCLYMHDSGSCDSASINIGWDDQSSASTCAQVNLNGHPTCMQAVTLVPSPGTTYKCHGSRGDYMVVTFTLGGPLPVHCGGNVTKSSTCHPTTSTPPTSPPTSSPTSSTSSTTITRLTTSSTPPPTQFSGLNPLIYTITAVALLGAASIVAMISCCIRQRRAMLRRREFLFGREYLDFMNERDFTQLTANQLAASLQEAPPTYQQSQEIEEQLKDAQEDTPPPLPPRNVPRNPPTPSDRVATDIEEEEDSDDGDGQNLI